MTKQEIEKAISEKKILYAADIIGVAIIDYIDEDIEYALSKDNFYIIDKEMFDLSNRFDLSIIYDNYEDAKKAFEEMAV